MYATWCEALLAGRDAFEPSEILGCPPALVEAWIHGYYTRHTCCDCIITTANGEKLFASTGIRIYQGGCVAK